MEFTPPTLMMDFTWGGVSDTVFSTTAAVINLTLYLYPMRTAWKIYTTGIVGGSQPYSYVALQGSALLWMLYTWLSPLPFDYCLYCLHLSAIAGCNIQSVYVGLFMKFSTKTVRTKMSRVLTVEGLIFMLPLVRTDWLKALCSPGREHIIGPVAVIFGIWVYASPLLLIKKAVQKNQAAELPFMFCTLLTLNAIFWLIGGYLCNDVYIVIANGVGLALEIVYLLAAWRYYMKLDKYNAGTDINEPLLPSYVS